MSNEEIMVAGARAKTEFTAEIDRFLSTLTDQGIFFIHVGEELVRLGVGSALANPKRIRSIHI